MRPIYYTKDSTVLAALQELYNAAYQNNQEINYVIINEKDFNELKSIKNIAIQETNDGNNTYYVASSYPNRVKAKVLVNFDE